MAETQTSQSAVGLTAEFVRLISLAAARQKDHRSPPADRNARRTGMVVVLLGLDGSGKTTVARKLCCLGETREQFSAVRYFHWRPNLFGPAPFPFPASGNVPRKAPGRGGLLNDWGSALRLLKNLALTRLAWAWRIRRLLSRTTLVIIDRYYYNYFLDPVSVRYYGPVSWLEKVRPLYPRPDLIVVLKAPAEVLGARKQELSEQEIMRQSTALERVFLDAPHTLAIDATQPASEIARSIFKRIQDLRQGQVPFDPLQGPTLKSAGPPALESNVP